MYKPVSTQLQNKQYKLSFMHLWHYHSSQTIILLKTNNTLVEPDDIVYNFQLQYI